jgi:mono/diheme cytochrome c family protein
LSDLVRIWYDFESLAANTECITSDEVGPSSISRFSAMYVREKILVLMLSATIPAVAASQEIGDAKKGLQYVSAVCSECHAVRSEQLVSPLPQAPSFEAVANTPGMTAIALTAWLQTKHPTMPNIVMGDAEMRDVIQYILSLKKN